MAGWRALFLAIIGVLSGARLGLDLLKGQAKRAARDLATPPPPQPRRPPVARSKQAKAAARHAKEGAADAAHKAGAALSHLLHRDHDAGDDPEAVAHQAGAAASASDKPASHPAGAAAHRDVTEIKGGFGYVMELFKRFGADHCPAWAASLSFFSILSIPPVLLCGLAVLGFLIDDPAEAQAQVERAMANVLPGGGRAAQQQAHLIAEQFNIAESAQHLRETSGTAFLIGIWVAGVGGHADFYKRNNAE
jgi:hypothetical protein